MEAKLKKMVKKKSFWIIAILVLILAVIAVFVLRARSRIGKMTDAAAQSVQSMVVEKGTVSNSIEGNGSLESAAEVDVTAPTGIEVDEVLVESGDKVTKGQTLATVKKSSVVSALVDVEESLDTVEDELSDSDLTALEKEELTEKQNDLKEAQAQLNVLYENPVLTAAADGVIGSVNVSAGSSISSSGVSGSSSGSGSSGSSSGASSLGFGSISGLSDSSNSGRAAVSAVRVSAGNVMLLSGNAETADSGLTVMNDYSKLQIETPAAGNTPQAEIEETEMYTGTITWSPAADTFQAGAAYVATVELTAKEGYTFVGTTFPELEDAKKVKETIHSSGNTMTITVTYPKIEDAQSGGSGSGTQNSSDVQIGSSQTGVGTQNGGSTQSVGTQGGGGQSAGISGSALSGTSLSGSSGSSAGSSSSLYSAYETAAFTIETMEQVKVSISVDELDILSVEEGQKAEITLDALEDQTFEGTVTRVSNSASAGSGSAKYTVEITIPMDENMRIGMSASASIKVSEAADVLVIPMDALQQKGEELFVYTGTDEDGNLSSPVSVETGVSDGTSVEITSGLSEGDTIYYMKTSSSSQMTDMFPGGMGGGFGGNPGEGGMGGSEECFPGGDSDSGFSGGRGPRDNSGGEMPSGDK